MQLLNPCSQVSDLIQSIAAPAGSEGVGKAIAAELARHGLNVLLVSRSQAKLEAAAAEIRGRHSSVQVGALIKHVC
jgi:NADP-dependent 3-hydroxy acid dehydrogenase YdfG